MIDLAQVGNLICTGTSRFLNKIYGACTDGSVISSQTQSTKFLRQDGTWAAPSYSEVRDYHLGYNSTAKQMRLSYAIGSSETVVSSVTCGYASTAAALTTDAGHMSQPVYFSSGVPTKCGGIIFNRNIEGNGSHLIQTCDRVIVFAFRGGSTTVPVVGMLDRYGGITYISRNDNLATLSIQTSDSGYAGFKVHNMLSVYIEMFYIGWDTSVTP